LTPYDILRLKNGLKLSSSAFLKRYTVHHTGPASGLPIVTLNMQDQEDLQCPFVSERGCSVYQDRPGFCRIYPLARIVRRRQNESGCEVSYALIKEAHCLGFAEPRKWAAGEWMEDQAVEMYNEMSDLLMDIISLKNRSGKGDLSAEERELFYLSCYDIDRFRDFLLEKKLWEIHGIEEDQASLLEKDDVALLRFAMEWVKEALFGVEE
jgi:Fe-S-cluster containining protein